MQHEPVLVLAIAAAIRRLETKVAADPSECWPCCIDRHDHTFDAAPALRNPLFRLWPIEVRVSLERRLNDMQLDAARLLADRDFGQQAGTPG